MQIQEGDSMIIGIDVGGTHADGVLLQGSTIIAKNKVALNHGNLEEAVFTLLESLLPRNKSELTRIHLSTTLCTNALINNTLDKVGMFVQSGPGINPEFLRCGEDLYFLSGAVDHRGQVLRGPGLAEVERAALELREKNINAIGIVTKFSHRNNEHELWVKEKIGGDFLHISMGHRMSGLPNFPRRVYTTWLNSGLQAQVLRFKEEMERGFARLSIDCPCYILKADGGTIPFAGACELPSLTIHSGPSASVLGALALVGEGGDAILLDIGGTTTDIGLFADGVPLLEPYGATVGGRPTLIRALLTRSIGLGGDSAVTSENGQFRIGPERKGAPMGFGGSVPTPTDAMIVLGTITEGSAARAREAMAVLRPEEPAEKTAAALLGQFSATVQKVVAGMIEEVFSRPVYTVSAFLEREKLSPERLIVIGGPAAALQPILQSTFALPCVVPDDYEVANAIGAARARLTTQATLYADTNLGRLSIPEISCQESIGRRFDMEDAEERLTETVREMASHIGTPSREQIDFTERLEMNTVRGFATTGRIISLKAQIRPGLAEEES